MKSNKEFKKYKLFQTIKHTSRFGNLRNYCKCWKGVSKDHFLVMCQIVHKLVNQGYEVYTECEIGKNRVDIAAISPEGKGFIVEALKSEPESSYVAKLDSYDINWIMVKVDCDDFDIEKFEI